ncbi:MAG: ABC transporter permease [Clostridia bacterium]|nr:ABC transporter permease [Clostridia bacterium]
MKNHDLKYVLKLELMQSLRSTWFWSYSILFGGFVAIMFALGITESQVIGFLGLGRLMITFMQVCIVVLPIYILITTVRSIVGDRETHVMEYFLSLPISFSSYLLGKFISRYIEIFTPVFLALTGAVLWGMFQGIDVPWDLFALYVVLLAVLTFCFLGIGMMISVKANTQTHAIGSAFILWLLLVALLDIILMGAMLKLRISPELVIGFGMINPLQVFRTGVLVLFDPSLTVMGAASYYILDTVGRGIFITFSIIYPLLLGFLFLWLSLRSFKNNDVV